MISTVTGNFQQFDVQVETDNEDFNQARVAFTAEVSSISTNNEQRDGHLKSGDFFEADQHPQIKFTGTSVTNGKGEYSLDGELTIKGVTNKISIPVEFGGIARDPWGNTKAAFSIDTKINRKDYGLSWNASLETGGVLLGEDIRILAEIQLAEQPAA